MARALAARDACLGVLEVGAIFETLPDFEQSDQCDIRPQVHLSGIGASGIAALKTRCQTALRLAMWERHGIQPAAARHLNAEVREITYFSSYSCRKICSTSGRAGWMSTHATADAIDISGFVLSNGSRLSLTDDWSGVLERAAFLRDVRDSACD